MYGGIKMRKELERKLVEDFPKIFRYAKEKTKPLMPMIFGFECGDGWYPILNKMCKMIEYEVEKKEAVPVEALQVKEKFGGLRFYINGGSEKILDIIDLFESISYIVCENCGTTSNVEERYKGNWVYTRCDSCWEKMNAGD